MKEGKFPLVLLFSFLLSACSSSFAYNNIDWLMYWYVDDYVDLSPSQKDMLDERVALWQDWHRSIELQKYQDQLKNLKIKLDSGPLNQDQWLREFDEAQEHLNRFRTKIAPELAEAVQQLSLEQIEGALSALDKKRQESLIKFEKQTVAERLKRREERLSEPVEDNMGKLSQLQTDIIKKYAHQFIPTFSERTAYQRTLQNAAKDIFANRNAPEFKQQLVSLIGDPDHYKTSEYEATLAYNTRLYAKMLAELNLTFTQEQKLRLDAKLDEWVDLIDELISG
jgi:hypothetical protein